MYKTLKECLGRAMDQHGIINAAKIGQGVTGAALSNATNTNGRYAEMDLHVYLSDSVPLNTYRQMERLPGFNNFHDNLPEVEVGPAGNVQTKTTVWIRPDKMKEFTQGLRLLPGFIGVALSEHCDPWEYQKFERFCTPGPA